MNEHLLKSVAEFCPLKVAKRFLGNGHSYILTRSAKIVTKFMIAFVEMRKAICSLRVPIDHFDFDFDSTKRAFFISHDSIFSHTKPDMSNGGTRAGIVHGKNKLC